MIEQKCDLCKCDAKWLNPLKDDYQLSSVKQVCDDCLKELNNILLNIDVVIIQMKQSWFRNVIDKILKRNQMAKSA